MTQSNAGDKVSAVQTYFAELSSKYQTGQAREHAYRPVFESLIKSLDPKLKILNDPSRSEHGNPDFVFLRGDITVGYVETKDIGVDLDKTEKTNQMERYLGYSNLILTDYLEFRFFRNGTRYGEVIRIGEIRGGVLSPNTGSFDMLANTLCDFLKGKPEPIKSGRRLAEIMGGKGRRIRDNVKSFLSTGSEKNRELERVYETIKKLLVHDLSPEAFADMYAQTLVYGLFAARFNDEDKGEFTRQRARDLVPASNPFLRHFFDHIVGPDFDKRLAYIVNELCEVFSCANVHELMNEYFKKGDLWGKTHEGPDPVIHFYEDFLKEYDAEQRKKLGAFYTPLPVVRFIIRAVDSILEKEFLLPKGLADTTKISTNKIVQDKKGKVDVHKVQILDPASGTGTFLNETIRSIAARFKDQSGRWGAYVDSDLLPRLHGFELMMAPYTIAHLKLAMTLRETGYTSFNHRLGIYLTNSLEESETLDGTLFGGLGLSSSIADEAREASIIKSDTPIMVVIGNPPYSAISSNKSASYLVEKYKVEPGGKTRLKERKNWLDDDYVKFISLAENLVEKNGEGILAYITNNGFIDNPTFRGVRWHLLKTFSDIYILDLHGNAKRKEKTPDGNKDENIFNIMQGVSINIFVKKNNKDKKGLGNIYHIDLYGKREDKFNFLNENDLEKIKWEKIQYTEPYYFFKPKDFKEKVDYDKGFSLTELFKENVTGIVTMGDEFIITKNRKRLEERLNQFLLENFSEQELKIKYNLGKNYAKWIIENKCKNKIVLKDSKFTQINYRPFDVKWIYYDKSLVWRCRDSVMSNFISRDNLGLVFKRGDTEEKASPGFVSKNIIDFRSWSRSGMQGGDYIAPLYLYLEDGSKIPNLKKEIVDKIEKIVDKTTPENVFDYIYAILHSLNYREKYKEFLKIDFPCVPYPKDKNQFHQLIKFGSELRSLHLLESSKLNNFITTYPIAGDNHVDKIKRDGDKIFINSIQYFGNISDVAWNFYIGGYLPAQKWLKDRKGHVLSNDEIEHYQKIIVALSETDKIMKEIDKIN